MADETWSKKMDAYFNLYGKGETTVTKSSYVDDFCGRASNNLPPEKVKQINSLREILWNQLMGGKGVSSSVSKEDFKKNMSGIYEAAQTMATLRETFSTFFVAVDTNNDNMIDPSEFAAILSLYGLGPDVAEAGFKALDDNDDGLVSREEFVDGFLRFYTTPSGGNTANLFGKIA